jgi:hypothetical protein
MDQKVYRRAPETVAALGPRKNRQELCTAEWKERGRVHIGGDAVKDTARPAIQRVWRVICEFGALAEDWPECGFVWTYQRNRSIIG